MKTVINNHNEITLKNNPYPIRFLGVFFFLVSSLFVYGSLGGYSNYAQATALTIKLHFLGGAFGVCIGSALILTKSVFVKISAATQSVGIIKSNLLGKKETSVPFYKIKQFFVSEKTDDGSLIWKVDMELESDETVELTSVWHSDKEQCEEAVNTANNALSKKPL